MRNIAGNLDCLEVAFAGDNKLFTCILDGMELEGMNAKEKRGMMLVNFAERVVEFYLPCLIQISQHFEETQRQMRKEVDAMYDCGKK